MTTPKDIIGVVRELQSDMPFVTYDGVSEDNSLSLVVKTPRFDVRFPMIQDNKKDSEFARRFLDRKLSQVAFIAQALEIAVEELHKIECSDFMDDDGFRKMTPEAKIASKALARIRSLS